MTTKQVTIKYGSVKSSQAFAQAMGKLMNTAMDTKTAYNLTKIKNAITTKIDTIRTEFRKDIIEKYGKRDEAGKLLTNDANPDAFAPDEKTFEEFLVAEKAFSERTFTLDRFQIAYDMLPPGTFSPNEIEALDGVVDFEGLMTEKTADILPITGTGPQTA